MVHPRLIVVEDQPGLSQPIASYLGRHGFLVRTAVGGRALDACLAQEPADLLILDVNTPGADGLGIARRIHLAGSSPILMLTSANEVADRVLALDLGVDDYLSKPFDPRELWARVRSILRRTSATPRPALAAPGQVGVTSPFAQNCTARPMHGQLAFRTGF